MGICRFIIQCDKQGPLCNSGNLVPRVTHLTAPAHLRPPAHPSFAPWGSKMRDPGNEVAFMAPVSRSPKGKKLPSFYCRFTINLLTPIGFRPIHLLSSCRGRTAVRFPANSSHVCCVKRSFASASAVKGRLYRAFSLISARRLRHAEEA